MAHKQECGCYCKHNDEIVYCPIHEAAPALVEALEAFVEAWEKTDVAFRMAQQALAQVGE